jgi:signal recognition particle GTPase
VLTLPSLVVRQSSDGLAARMAGQEQLIRSLGGSTTKGVDTPQEVNVHFMTPQSVSNLFVGRKLELLQLKQDLEGRGPAQSTMRVVVHGLNGSGKTQFCCKFAQDNRSR